MADFKAEVFALVGDNEKLKKTRIQKDFQNYNEAKAFSSRNGDVFYAITGKYESLERLLNYRKQYGGTKDYAILPEGEELLEQYDKNEYHVEAVTLEKRACASKLEWHIICNTDLKTLSKTDLINAMKTVADLIYMSKNKLSFSNITAFTAEKARVLLNLLGIRFEIAPGRGNTGNISEVSFYDWNSGDGITFCSIKDRKVDNHLPSESPECWDLDGRRSFADDRIQKIIDALTTADNTPDNNNRKLETREVKEMKTDLEPAKSIGRIIPKEEPDGGEFVNPIVIMGNHSEEPDDVILLSEKENRRKLEEAYRKQDLLLWKNGNFDGGRDDR